MLLRNSLASVFSWLVIPQINIGLIYFFVGSCHVLVCEVAHQLILSWENRFICLISLWRNLWLCFWPEIVVINMTVVIHSSSLPISCYGKVKAKDLLWANSVFLEISSSHFSLLSLAAAALISLSKYLYSLLFSSRIVRAASAIFSFLEKMPPLSLIRRLLDIRALIKSFICYDLIQP